MASNLIQNGETIKGITPAGGYTNGQLVVVGSLVGIVNDDYAATEPFVAVVESVWSIDKVPAADNAFAQGDAVYVTGGGLVNDAPANNTFVGLAWEAATTTASSVTVKLNWGNG